VLSERLGALARSHSLLRLLLFAARIFSGGDASVGAAEEGAKVALLHHALQEFCAALAVFAVVKLSSAQRSLSSRPGWSS
jgi:hypothetical protein